MTIRYPAQKLFEATNALIGDPPLEKRLAFALSYLIPVQPEDVPEDLRAQFLDLKDTLSRSLRDKTSGYGIVDLSPAEANKMAHRILSLFVEVMGGLPA